MDNSKGRKGVSDTTQWHNSSRYMDMKCKHMKHPWNIYWTPGNLPGILGEFPLRCQHWLLTSSPDPNLDVSGPITIGHQSWKFLKAHAQPAMLHAPGNHAPWPMMFHGIMLKRWRNCVNIFVIFCHLNRLWSKMQKAHDPKLQSMLLRSCCPFSAGPLRTCHSNKSQDGACLRFSWHLLPANNMETPWNTYSNTFLYINYLSLPIAMSMSSCDGF